MSIVKRGESYYLMIRPFGKQVSVKTMARSKTEARQIEMALLVACRSGDYRSLDALSKEACVRLFTNQGLELPSDISGISPVKELTLWDAVEIFLRYPSIKDCAAKERYGYCLANLVEKLGKDKPVKSIWVPDLRLYQSDRISDGAAPATVNREMSTLSRLFGTLIELQVVESNPCRLVKRLTPGHRESYISHFDFLRIVDVSPEWYKPMVRTGYYTGMRRSEVLLLSRKQVNLGSRIVRLGAQDTKEGKSKRIPIHQDLLPILDQCMKVAAIGTDRVFLIQDRQGARPPSADSLKNPWRRTIPKLGIDPAPTFHDLRHTWKTNARRSGMDPEIRESILGHWMKEKSVTERYGRIADAELVRAIDSMTFDHGETEIWACR